MMNIWSRDDTKAFLAEQQVLASTVLEYTKKTIKWCDNNQINDSEIIVAAVIMSAAWVYSNLDNILTVGIVADILDIPYQDQDHAINPNTVIPINNQLINLTHTKLLKNVTEAMI